MPNYRLNNPEMEAYCKRCNERMAKEYRSCPWLEISNEYCCDILDFDRILHSHWERTGEDIRKSKEYEN